MTNKDLARSYIFKAEKRLKILQVLYEEEDYSIFLNLQEFLNV
jgi:hypothetical protein